MSDEGNTAARELTAQEVAVVHQIVLMFNTGKRLGRIAVWLFGFAVGVAAIWTTTQQVFAYIGKHWQ